VTALLSIGLEQDFAVEPICVDQYRAFKWAPQRWRHCRWGRSIKRPVVNLHRL